jgi:hypothetical protein
LLADLLTEAGFSAVGVTTDEITLRFPSAEEFVGIVASGAPSMLGALVDVSGATRRALLDDVARRLAPYTDATGVAFPLRGNIAAGRR